MLAKEITNDLLVTLKRSQYSKCLTWVYTFLQENAHIHTRKINGGEDSSLSGFNAVDFERFEEFKKKVSHNDVYGAELVISNSLKEGIAPQFSFLYSVLALCLNEYIKRSFQFKTIYNLLKYVSTPVISNMHVT